MAGDLARYAAVNARVRTLIAQQVGREGLRTLAAYPGPGSVLEALSRTAYGPMGDAEADRCLADRARRVADALLVFLLPPERELFDLFARASELESLKLVVRLVPEGVPEASLRARLGSPVPSRQWLDPLRLSGIHNFQDLAARLAGTPWRHAIEAELSRRPAAGVPELESALEIHFWDLVWDRTGALRSADRPAARHLLGILGDVLNVGWMLRFRDVFEWPEAEVRAHTTRARRWLDDPQRDRVASGRGRSLAVLLTGTPYAAFMPAGTTRDAELIALWRFLDREARRTLRGEPFHVGVPLAFFLRQTTEIRDLQSLLAGKRLGIAAGGILARLAGVGD
jgi:hypothetical protein